ncbi:Eco57I restriction-modification methylase domain-containing protein [Edwardsiella ictaluri]|uniref:site-specific DNA-methyltransferase (adenine-specific) n=1 Tax=Edwardsiella ictaluri TaxID=67780 RepID=A0A1P8YZM5_EDWIC|nr:Eco57I restriction-modification methylase domain-containing protein [Edwardsiella ictaluri]AQD17704.1 putative type IIS restriction/modification enzyme [Edwardsiella ictaluri]ELV7529318.1 Eco57I restriction-modification methylase domain-containing protein [Edwardsiella ictaluri]WFN97922.1 Eco57I restriction-modification methylase domain-containing protein [Edwardsiella ictaluri]
MPSGLNSSYNKQNLVHNATEMLATQGSTETRGAIFTRQEVVEFILTLSGYNIGISLHKMRFLEPSFGRGDFLLPAIRRLLKTWNSSTSEKSAFDDLKDSIRAVELHYETYAMTFAAVVSLLVSEGIGKDTATKLTHQWLIRGDFLLTPLEGKFDFVVGNPPYVRQELIPTPLLREYRRLYTTMYDRADLYVPFIERSLSLLSKGGVLGFICSDRWMKNKYGGPLRQLISQSFNLKTYIDMVDTAAFHTDVSTYPAITIISHAIAGKTRIAHRPKIDSNSLTKLAASLLLPKLADNADPSIREIANVTNGAEPWLLESADQIDLIRRLEKSFPLLEDTGCKVGIGVATGADRAFIGEGETLDVEADRIVPLVMTQDIVTGKVKWLGRCVINPFTDSGQLVNLSQYPKLKAYLEKHRSIIENRHCARKTPDRWYRTIDRITPSLTKEPKLLIPDIKGKGHVVFESGEFYPHHNLYYITSTKWELRALQAVLLSAISRLFIATYSTKMRGGYLRFQAQYLRRIRLPQWEHVTDSLRKELTEAAVKHDIHACNKATFKLYGLSSEEQSSIGGK